MRIMISGASGFVGRALLHSLAKRGLDVYPIYHLNSIDHTNATFCNFQDSFATKKIINKISPDVFVHCAAVTNVDLCERKKIDCWNANVIASLNVCRSVDKNIHFVHISTAQVFDGREGNYNEESIRNPINWYGTTKSISEQVVMNILNRWTLVRFSNIYGFDFTSKNFFHLALTRLLRDEKISAAGDKIISPTYIDTVVSALTEIILERIYGVLHVADLESSTKYEILLKLSKILHKKGLVLKEKSSNIFNAKRPDNTSLDISKFSESLKYGKPLTLNQGLSDFVCKFRYSFREST